MASTALAPPTAAAAGGGGPMDAAARRFLPPPGVHPNGAVFGAANLPKPLTWQRREHMVQRRNLLRRIGQLLKPTAQRVVDTGGDDATTWALARKLEVLLFINSASLLEYSNVDSLARRVQALTASVVNKKIRRQVESPTVVVTTTTTAAMSTAATASPSPSPQHQYAPPPPLHQQSQQPQPHVQEPPRTTSFTDMMRSAMAYLPPPSIAPPLSSIPAKRSASSDLPVLAPAKRSRVAAPPPPLGQLLFRGVDELTKMVWGFVDGVEVMRSAAVCRAARPLAPLLVTSLQLSCNAMLRALSTLSRDGHCVLRQCVHLTHLEVVSLASGMRFGKLSMRAMNCPQRFVVTHDDHEQIVRLLAAQLRTNAFPLLRRLGLTCLFTNEEADGEADVLLNNLMTGCCPQLEELCLPGNSFGDYGAMKIAQMLRARVCPKLTRLDLRRNFIAEEGIRSVCHALADGCAPQLLELCLGGNTITDSCFHHVLFAMESRKLERLAFVGIEMNYLTATSMEMLGRTIGKLVCPRLAQISYSDNSVPNTDAKRIIATAVYQERMFRLRQQQLRHQQRVAGKALQRQQQQQSHGPAQGMALPATTLAMGLPHPQQQHMMGGGMGARPGSSFPYHAAEFAAASGDAGAMPRGGYFADAGAAYSSGEEEEEEDDEADDDAYSSDGE